MRTPILLTLVMACAAAVYAADGRSSVVVLTGGGVKVSETDNAVRASGYGRELIAKLMQEAGVDYSLEPQPFARALKTLEGTANTMLFPIVRTVERESKYQWVGLMAKRDYYLYRLDSRKDIVIQSLDDARRYRIGVMRGDVRADYLRSKGFVEGTDKGLEVVNVAFSLLKMQQSGRIDLIVFSDEGLKLVCQEAALACDAFVPAYRLDIAGNLWLVASPLMPEDRVNALKKAFRKLEDAGFVGKLMKSGRPVGG